MGERVMEFPKVSPKLRTGLKGRTREMRGTDWGLFERPGEGLFGIFGIEAVSACTMSGGVAQLMNCRTRKDRETERPLCVPPL